MPGQPLNRAIAAMVAVLASTVWPTSAVAADQTVDPRRPQPYVSSPLHPRSSPRTAKLFSPLLPTETGIAVQHVFPDKAPLTLLQDQGGGIGLCVGDYDGDGWADLFVTRYDQGCHLYRNRGQWRFEDVTERAGVSGAGRWCGGASFVDLDQDGDLDLTVCVYNAPNLIYVNHGDGTFQEQAQARGLGFAGASVMLAYADYDIDGVLDAYLVTHRLGTSADARLPRSGQDSVNRGVLQIGPDRQPRLHPRYAELFGLMDKARGRMELFIAGQRDLLFRQVGVGQFVDMTTKSGIQGHDIGLAATWWDYDQDGRPDLYVSNDYKGPDRLWRNQGNGTFVDVARTALPHVPWSSMGADTADVNNDGRLDLLATDMAGSQHRRRMLILDDLRERWFLETSEPRQYSRNALYLATGTEHCLEAAYLAGLANTDWTWAPKFGDFDNDGWVDLFIANGMAHDFLNADLLDQMRDRGHPGWKSTPMLRERNLAFRNLSQLQFQEVGNQWGIDDSTASYSAVTADFDRDGDLDLIVSDLGQPLRVYRNDSQSGHSVLIRLQGLPGNRWGIGALVQLEMENGIQTRTVSSTSGFMSANEPLIHFGLGTESEIRRIKITWPGGLEESYADLVADRLYTFFQPTNQAAVVVRDAVSPLFRASSALAALRHREQPYDDFQREPLLPWKLSQLGPGLGIADVNDDGLEDMFLGGAAGQPGMLAIRGRQGRFLSAPQRSWVADQSSEDMGTLFFDADRDGDQDLFVVSGSAEFPVNATELRDRLYLNDGRGQFELAPTNAIPALSDSGSVVAAADFDRDGDLDLFVGGRCLPGRYPLPVDSRLLRNDGGTFAEVTASVAPGLLGTGLVTSAIWSDANNDGWVDLLVTHEWGPVKVFLNRNGRLVEASGNLAHLTGWWHGIAAGDVDRDGDVDYVVTNNGLNTRYHASPKAPAVLLLGDFESAGQNQLVEATYEEDRLVPLRSRNALTAAIPSLTGRFPSAKTFAEASLTDILTEPKLEMARRFTVTTLESGLLSNNGQAQFTFRPLPRLAQIAPAFGLALIDVDADGTLDLVLAQNFYGPQPETGRMDGGLSLVLRGHGDGTFVPLWPAESGLVVRGDAKSLVVTDLNTDGWPDLVLGVNDAAPQAFELLPRPGYSRLAIRLHGRPGNPTGVGSRIELITEKGQQLAEVYAGGGYLSQSSPVCSFGWSQEDHPKSLRVRWPRGSVTSLPLEPGQSRVDVRE